MYPFFFKRVFDFLFSAVLLVLLSPIILIITVYLFFYNKRRPFFTQHRPGLNGKIIKIIKFRTMRDLKDENGQLLPDYLRITSVGKFIRATSLDELPQFINVLKGDMSLIGPRPLLVQYLPLYSDFQKRRHEVRPGITGWAQVNGRNAVSWQKRFELDVWYVDHVSFWVDIRILLLTIIKVLKRDGINASAAQTMSAFTGNE